MPLSTEHVLQSLAQQRDLLRRLGVRRLALFGSRARGDENVGSDLDFLVELERKTFDAYMDVKECLESMFDCRVDLVLADAVRPSLREAIMRDAVDAPGL